MIALRICYFSHAASSHEASTPRNADTIYTQRYGMIAAFSDPDEGRRTEMAWEPTEQETAILRNLIAVKFGWVQQKATKENAIDQVLGNLKACSGKKQANAVLDAVTTANDIEVLRKYGFDLIANNALKTIQTALAEAPGELVRRNAQELAQNATNLACENYVNAISNKYLQHMAGNHVNLPVEDYVGNVLTQIGRHYNNGEGILPGGGHYIEWYPVIAGKRSAHKRVFTRKNDPRIWISNGGTHGSKTEWWLKDGVNWTKKP